MKILNGVILKGCKSTSVSAKSVLPVTFKKLDFQRAVLNRIPVIEAHPERYFRQVFFLCDEYQHFATVGENEPTGDEKFFSLSRQPKCIPIVAKHQFSQVNSPR